MAKHFGAAVTSTAYKVTKTCIAVECDICHKTIPVKKRNYTDRSGRYFEITTGHNDWGNDSIESIETRDVCDECAPQFIYEYLDGIAYSNTAYMKVKNKIVCGYRESDIVDNPPKEGETIVEQHDYF